MSYVYKEDDMSWEELYLKKWFLTYFNVLGYVEGVILQDEASRKILKRLIEAYMLMDANTKEERKVIFSKLLSSLSFYVCHLFL